MLERTEPRKQVAVFCVSRFRWPRPDATGPLRHPGSLVHAKEMGTAFTVCGQYCSGWFKFWDRPFDLGVADRCPECVAVLVLRPR